MKWTWYEWLVVAIGALELIFAVVNFIGGNVLYGLFLLGLALYFGFMAYNSARTNYHRAEFERSTREFYEIVKRLHEQR